MSNVFWFSTDIYYVHTAENVWICSSVEIYSTRRKSCSINYYFPTSATIVNYETNEKTYNYLKSKHQSRSKTTKSKEMHVYVVLLFLNYWIQILNCTWCSTTPASVAILWAAAANVIIILASPFSSIAPLRFSCRKCAITICPAIAFVLSFT